MNFSKSILSLFLFAILFTGCKQSEVGPKEDTIQAKSLSSAKKRAIDPKKLETASFTIDGMTCAIGCARTIEKELSETNGVQKAAVDFDKKTATVAFDSSQQTPENLTKIVEATADGKTYKVSNFSVSKVHAIL